MKEEGVTDALLREFLLGKVDDEARERIESLFITDSQARERVLGAEQDLIEDYLENNLTTADRESFLSRYAQTGEQRRKLKITKSIKDFAVTRAKVTQPVPTSSTTWDRLRARLRPVFVVPIAVAIVIAIVVAVWVNKIEQRNRHLAIEQELARLNAHSSLREVPPQMLSFNLSAVTVRSAEGQNEVKRRADTRIVELRLPWLRREQYKTYRAVIRRLSNDETFTVTNLPAEDEPAKVIRIRLPADILTRGVYQIELSGIAADGSTSAVEEEYNFTVSE